MRCKKWRENGEKKKIGKKKMLKKKNTKKTHQSHISYDPTWISTDDSQRMMAGERSKMKNSSLDLVLYILI